MKLVKILFFSLISLAALSFLAGLSLHLYTEFFLYPKIFAAPAKFQTYENLILGDLKTLEKHPIFKKNEYKSDASEFLKTALNSQSSPNQVIERLFNTYPNWVDDKMHFYGLTADPQFADLNPKWIEKIKTFDHWKAATTTSLDFEMLKDWAAVYAIKKLQIKDLNAGLKIYRKAAELINSAGNLNSQLQAVLMLESEHKLMNDFQARDWHLIPITSLEAYRRLSWGWIHIDRQSFYKELKVEYKNYALPQFGVCASAHENATGLFSARDFLVPKSYFEESFAQNYDRAQEFQKMILERCRLADQIQAFEPSSNSEHRKTFQNLNWTRFAIVRRYLGLKLFLSSTPDALSVYQDLASEKKQN